MVHGILVNLMNSFIEDDNEQVICNRLLFCWNGLWGVH